MLRQSRRAGFTLIELMVVVAIIGTLSVVAIPAFSAYIYRSRASEAPVFLGEIRQRQEAYRAEFGQYCAVSGTEDWGDFQPEEIPGADPQPFDATEEWLQLGAVPDGLVRFQYATIAGPPGTEPPGDLGFDGSDFWFVAQAKGDLDDDGNEVTMEAYSASNHIWISETQGWE